MINKRYLNMVLSYMVRSSKIYYEKETINLPYTYTSTQHSFPLFLSSFPFYYSYFYSYCEKHFGLNKDEIVFVWGRYHNIIRDKIGNGE